MRLPLPGICWAMRISVRRFSATHSASVLSLQIDDVAGGGGDRCRARRPTDSATMASAISTSSSVKPRVRRGCGGSSASPRRVPAVPAARFRPAAAAGCWSARRCRCARLVLAAFALQASLRTKTDRRWRRSGPAARSPRSSFFLASSTIGAAFDHHGGSMPSGNSRSRKASSSSAGRH